MTRRRLSEHELEATLTEVGERLAYPRPTRFADGVRARLREGRPSPWWDALRSPRYAFAPLVATVAVLALVVVLAVPGARAAASDFLHAWGIDIFRAPAIATPAVSPSPRAGLGALTTLDSARLRADPGASATAASSPSCTKRSRTNFSARVISAELGTGAATGAADMDSAIEALDFETEPAQKLYRRGSEDWRVTRAVSPAAPRQTGSDVISRIPHLEAALKWP